ncbi:MAG: mshA [Acidimicrobiia bacterium]|nr:mshA [Acidimicrobiia bacterium]
MQRVAVLSFHTSPLVQPGSGDSGGMNVYVRELSAALAQSRVDCTVFTRRWRPDLPDEVNVEPGFRVVHVDAGPHDLPKEALADRVKDFSAGVREYFDRHGEPDLLHANYWLSGVAGHQLKHELDLPLVSTFHTLARVKVESGDDEPLDRDLAEASVIGCADAICVSCTEEADQFRRLYGEPPGRLEIVAPGVEHALFAPGDRAGARHALGLSDHPMVLFVGRIQPLKGADVAVRALAALDRQDARLVIVGGASGRDGGREVAKLTDLVASLGLTDRVSFVPPQPHHLLSTWYRAADVVLVPSRSESFGLVALEAAASGIPVVASAVGGLITLVDHGRTGFLVEGRDPLAYAAHIDELLANPRLAAAIGTRAALRSRPYTWKSAAARLQRVYADLLVGRLVQCS